jgi:hypothetical protein
MELSHMTFTGTPFCGTAEQYVREPGGTIVGFSMRLPGQLAPAAGVDS